MPKVYACCHISVGRSWTITKLPFNKSCSCPQFSRLFLIPLISSLSSALCLEAYSCLSSLLSALPSPCCYKPLHGKSLSFLLSSVESSSSSSSMRIPLYFFYKFYLSNLIREIHFEGRVLINKTPSNTDLLPKTTRYQHLSEIIYLFLPIKKKFKSCMLCSC